MQSIEKHRTGQSGVPKQNAGRRCFSLACTASLLGLLALHPLSAKADSVTVHYTTHQVSGSTWQYDYSVSGSLAQGDDLAILFPLATSASLADNSATSADVSTFVLQPDAALSADGEFDLMALATDPNLLQTFSTTFLYTGAGTPGSQAFSLYDPSFNLLSSGTTTVSTPVAAETPEPASILLAVTGALGALGLSRRRSLQQI